MRIAIKKTGIKAIYSQYPFSLAGLHQGIVVGFAQVISEPVKGCVHRVCLLLCCGWVAFAFTAASLAAIHHPLPVVLPFLSPGEGPLANRTNFLGQIGFLVHVFIKNM
jgi:hypothetical protein